MTDLRTSSPAIFRSLKKPKCIVVRNKPKAMLIHPTQYKQFLAWKEGWNTVVDFGEEGIAPQDLLDIHAKC